MKIITRYGELEIDTSLRQMNYVMSSKKGGSVHHVRTREGDVVSVHASAVKPSHLNVKS